MRIHRPNVISHIRNGCSLDGRLTISATLLALIVFSSPNLEAKPNFLLRCIGTLVNTLSAPTQTLAQIREDRITNQLRVSPEVAKRYLGKSSDEELLSYQRLKTDFFEVAKVSAGNFGGKILTIKTKGTWRDVRKIWEGNGQETGDIIQDLRANPAILGREGARLFGYMILDDEYVTVPDEKELNGAIEYFNSHLDPNDDRRISITVYSSDELFEPYEVYAGRFYERGAIPVTMRGRQFYHDITSHGIEGVFANNEVISVFRKRDEIWFRFKKWVERHAADPTPQQEKFEKNWRNGVQRISAAIDKLGMGSGDFINPNLKIYIRSVGAYRAWQGEVQLDSSLVPKLRLSRNSTGLVDGSEISDFQYVMDPARMTYNNFLDKEFRPIFTQFLNELETTEPELFAEVSFDLKSSIVDIQEIKKIRNPKVRMSRWIENPFAAPIYFRLQALNQMATQYFSIPQAAGSYP